MYKNHNHDSQYKWNRIFLWEFEYTRMLRETYDLLLFAD